MYIYIYMCVCVWKHLICHRRLKRHCVSWVCHPSPKGSGHRDAPNLMVCVDIILQDLKMVMWISILGQVYNILTVIYSSHMFTFFIFRGQELTLALFLYSGTATVVLILSSHKLVRINYNQLRQELKLTWDSNMTATCSEHVQSVNEYLTDLTDLTDLHALLYSDLVSLEWCWMATDWDVQLLTCLQWCAEIDYYDFCRPVRWGYEADFRYGLVHVRNNAEEPLPSDIQWYPVISSDSEKQESTREELEKNSLYLVVFLVESFAGFSVVTVVFFSSPVRPSPSIRARSLKKRKQRGDWVGSSQTSTTSSSGRPV